MTLDDPAAVDTSSLQLQIQSLMEEAHSMLGAAAAAPAVTAMRTAILELSRAQTAISPHRRYGDYNPD